MESDEKEPAKLDQADSSPADESEEPDMHDVIGEELMGAIHSKDHKKLMQGLEAAVLSCLNKKGDDNA
jgi:hypothetical protein